jgi:hypothetical protein
LSAHPPLQANLERYIFDLHNFKGVTIHAGWASAGTPRSVVPKVCRLDIPQQNNGDDCGFFMLTFADFEVCH